MTHMTIIAPELVHETIAQARRDAAEFRIRSRPDLDRPSIRRPRTRTWRPAVVALLRQVRATATRWQQPTRTSSEEPS
jgi:hypothetical protein